MGKGGGEGALKTQWKRANGRDCVMVAQRWRDGEE